MAQQADDYKKEIINIFFAQSSVIVPVTILIFVASILIAFYWPPTFAAYGDILVKGKKMERSPGSLEQENVMVRPITKEDLFSEVQILTSTDVVIKTIQYLRDFNQYPKSVKGTGPMVFVKGEVKKILDRVARYLDENQLLPRTKKFETIAEREKRLLEDEARRVVANLKTKVSPASTVINISYFHPNQDFAITFLSALMEQYIIYRMELYSPAQTKDFFSEQAGKFRTNLERKEDELLKLVQKTGMSDPLKEIENNLLVKKEIELQLSMLKEASIEKKLLIEYLKKALAHEGIQYFSFIKESPIHAPDGLSVRLQELVNERGRTMRIFHPASSKVKKLDQQIKTQFASLKDEVIRYKDSLVNDYQIVEEKISYIESRISAINHRNVDLKSQQLLAQRIETEAKLLMDSFEIFSKRREEAGIKSSSGVVDFFISVLKKAFPSKGPIFPKKNVVIPLGLFVGFITGCSLGFTREYFDNTFKHPSDVDNTVSAPLIFSIPEYDEVELCPHEPRPNFEEALPPPPKKVLGLTLLG